MENCKHCLFGGRIGFSYSYAKRSEEFARAVAAIKLLKPLRYGQLFVCKQCENYWYLYEKLEWMQRVPVANRDQVEEWNRSKVELNPADLKTLLLIGENPSNVNRNTGATYMEFPCSVTTVSGDTYDKAMVCFDNRPPLGKNDILGNKVAHVSPSPHTLSQEIRHATYKAREVSRDFFPTEIEVGGELFVFNGLRNFFEHPPHQAHDARLSKTQSNGMRGGGGLFRESYDYPRFLFDSI